MATTDWWRGATMYQIYPRSFQDSNSDGVGDLAGISSRLDYVRDLGVDGIWISPFFKSPMKDFGYDVADYFTVDPLFGTNKDFDALISKAHGLGLKVIIDMVLSHTSDQCEWFQESRQNRKNPKADWYVWADPKPDGSPPNNWRSVFGGEAWEFDTRRGQYYLHHWLKEQPDLNFHNPEVQQQMLECCRYWLEKGVDGFRLDVINYLFHDDQLRDNPPARFEQDGPATQFSGLNPYSMQKHIYDKSRPEVSGFLKKLRALSDEYPGTMLLAEVGESESTLPAEYTDGPDMLHTAYSFDLLDQKLLTQSRLESVFTFFDSATQGRSWPSWAFSNHDVIRTATRWGDFFDPEYRSRATTCFLALLCCLRGTLFIYQGEELGLREADIPYEKLQDPWGKYLWPEWQGRDGCRTPMPWSSSDENCGFSAGHVTLWLPVPEEHHEYSVDSQDRREDSVLNITRDLIALRQKSLALRKGSMTFCESPSDEVIYFIRHMDDETVTCLFNLSNKTHNIKIHDVASSENILYKCPEAHIENASLTLPPATFFLLGKK